MIISNAYTRFQLQKEALLRGDKETVKRLAQEADESLKRKGYFQAKPLFSWIEKEWLDKSLKMEAIVRGKHGYAVLAIEREENTVVGHRGRSAITEKKKILDISKWLSFCKEYDDFKKSKTNQQLAIDHDLDRIIKNSNE